MLERNKQRSKKLDTKHKKIPKLFKFFTSRKKSHSVYLTSPKAISYEWMPIYLIFNAAAKCRELSRKDAAS